MVLQWPGFEDSSWVKCWKTDMYHTALHWTYGSVEVLLIEPGAVIHSGDGHPLILSAHSGLCVLFHSLPHPSSLSFSLSFFPFLHPFPPSSEEDYEKWV